MLECSNCRCNRRKKWNWKRSKEVDFAMPKAYSRTPLIGSRLARCAKRMVVYMTSEPIDQSSISLNSDQTKASLKRISLDLNIREIFSKISFFRNLFYTGETNYCEGCGISNLTFLHSRRIYEDINFFVSSSYPLTRRKKIT